MYQSIFNKLPENNYAMRTIRQIAQTGSEIYAANHSGYQHLVEREPSHANFDGPISWKRCVYSGLGSGMHRFVTVEYLMPAGEDFFFDWDFDYPTAKVTSKLTSESAVDFQEEINNDQYCELIMGFVPFSLMPDIKLTVNFPLDDAMKQLAVTEGRTWGLDVSFAPQGVNDLESYIPKTDSVRSVLAQLQLLRDFVSLNI